MVVLVTDCHVGYGAKYDMDFPKMHIISLPAPFWPGKKIDDDAMIATLQQGISELVRAKVSLIAVPCNLAHCYFAEMKAASAGIPLLHIADTALKSLPAEVTRITENTFSFVTLSSWIQQPAFPARPLKTTRECPGKLQAKPLLPANLRSASMALNRAALCQKHVL